MNKLFEKLVDDRIRHFLSDNLVSKQQQGFQKILGCTTAAFNLQETIYHNIELNNTVYTAFLDTQKAFDTVWHSGMLYKIYNKGITGKLWRVIVDAYQNMTSEVMINGEVSNSYSGKVSDKVEFSHLCYILYTLTVSFCNLKQVTLEQKLSH